jgi:putative membrane protein
MKIITLFTILLVATCLLSSPGQRAASATTATFSDRQFIRNAAYGGNDEIALSRLALTRASDPEIRRFARRMIIQHSEAGAQLSQIATSLGVSVPSGPDVAHRHIERRLRHLDGIAFDRAYINIMVDDHTDANQLFQSGATVDSSELRSFAIATLPIVQNHLKMAAEMQASRGMSHMAAM